MFTLLCTVVTTVLAAVVLGEELHAGSVIGAVAIVAGLYVVVLWSKAEDARRGTMPAPSEALAKAAAGSDGQQLDVENSALAAPLLADSPSEQEDPK
uniref:WAT1-related protein n=1 Tax=Arundo donax TaxID=35708 RepID=A0A0A9F297_ARUDO